MKYSKIIFLILVSILLNNQKVYAEISDCKLVYDYLSQQARKYGQLDFYENCPTLDNTIKIEHYDLKFKVPPKIKAYDVVPIKYVLSQPIDDGRWAYVKAVAFDMPEQPLYDLSVPGDVKVNIEYIGSISADYMDEYNIPLTPDGNSPVSPFPPYKRDSLIQSKNVRSAPLIWFKFRVTNIGDTILDPEGFSASFAAPRINKIGPDGKIQWTAKVANDYLRHLDYLYPGDSVEFWANFICPQQGDPNWNSGLKTGDYKIDFRMVARFYDKYDWLVNVWGGTEFARLEVPINVTDCIKHIPIETTLYNHGTKDKQPVIYSKFEEFMTTFHCHPTALKNSIDETLYLQVAPWTKHITVKLILTDPLEIKFIKVPIEIDKSTLGIEYNPNNKNIIQKDGIELPVFVSQPMPGMRTGIVFGPYPEKHMHSRLKEMKDLGVNVIINTSGDWHIHEMIGQKSFNPYAYSYKYFYDVLVPKLDLKLMGWSIYPPVNTLWYEVAGHLLNEKIIYSTTGKGYNGHMITVDMADKAVPRIIAYWVLFNYSRWGERWYRTRDGIIPVDIEDTWGWLRDDINVRYRVGPLAVIEFQKWLTNKYTTIEKLNIAWKTNFKNFEQIQPEQNQGVEGDNIIWGIPVYNKIDHPFHEWNAALEDWDMFRTILKMQIYKEANIFIRQKIPNAQLTLRSEGAAPVVSGAPYSEDMRQRMIYYAQRRNAMIYGIVKDADVLHSYSDYTTIPYSRYEWRNMMREMVDIGITPGFLPQFNHMRDMLISPYYGRDYQLHYNLDNSVKAIMVHTLMAAYPWWKATYEEGGMPGVIWEDYMCDGFMTQTQKRELSLLTEYFQKMKK